MKSGMHSFHFRFDAMGSGCEVVIVAETKKDAQSIAGCAIEEVSRIERKFSRYRSDSIVSRINATAIADVGGNSGGYQGRGAGSRRVAG